jgi:hypothetical protein
MKYVTNIKDGTSVEERPTRRWEDRTTVHLGATRPKNVTCGTVDLASCKTADPTASSDELSGLLRGIRVIIQPQLPINKTFNVASREASLFQFLC